MANEPSLPNTLELALATTVRTVDPCELASISLRRGKTLAAVAATDERLRRAVSLQMDLGQGPSLEALAGTQPVVSGDLRRDDRWPDWGPRIADDLGLRSVLSLRLIVGTKPQGVLSLYASAADAFSAADVATAQTTAAHAAVALADSLEREQLSQALASRTAIGQATGIVMERFGLDEDAAFGVLRRLSQNSNVPIRELAQQLVETRQLPPVTPRRPPSA
jgi:GAF domain-containing protein